MIHVAWLVGYDGHFLFDKIGDNYSDHNVPYVALRLWCSLCGAAVVPFAYLTMKEMGVSILGCVFGCMMLIFGTFLGHELIIDLVRYCIDYTI
jgi:dolichyl-phosphate-mannose-protein mannosyltransferase